MLNTVNFFLHCKFAMLGIVVLLHLVAESDSYLLLYCFFSLYTWHYYACFQILFIYLFQLNNLLMYCFLLFSLHETCYWLYFVVFLLLSFTMFHHTMMFFEVNILFGFGLVGPSEKYVNNETT